jgi:hypothetical protein
MHAGFSEHGVHMTPDGFHADAQAFPDRSQAQPATQQLEDF